ncbi:helix-turn-helix domain-containing protein [Streptomyces sp. PKU-EA00015]|uniref:bifunctional transcriptional activator/DNA repair enzyme AdaA n=1 Tax=Streptomyces sp. PKU-EA00015 TaxID=2748326 RepID=UPI0015A197C6|nr:AlkA N-terminal domain-containing protein [Streptomyces sp. PKU-EA00015]NWF24826.1 helix-turn-helix domain-containing protein [Streptomyces sp. PKU-EA00015]
MTIDGSQTSDGRPARTRSEDVLTGAPTEDSRYQAVTSRDARFDGIFFFAVSTTGIYCRPSCPAVTPKRRNVSFYRTAAAAQSAGYRACRRCRPDAVPGSAEWNVRADVVGRAMRLIGDGVVDREGVAGLATRLGYSARQVQRQLNAELGAGPMALARAQRGHTARVLLQTTTLQAAEIAFAAGFASVRQFNDTIREIYAATPSELRSARPARALAPGGGAGVPLRLAYRGPYAARDMVDHLAARSIPGVEEVVGNDGSRTYRRTLRLPGGAGVAEVSEQPGPGGWLECRLHLADLRDLTTATQRVRRLFDLDADPCAVADRLGADPVLAPLVAARPGLRVPGAADPHEAAIRVVAGGSAADLVAAYGEELCVPSGGLTRLFPRAESLTEAGTPALRSLATALASGDLTLDPGADREETERRLLALPGIDAATAARIRMHALGDPDVLLPDDPALPAGADPERWRPWRSYALQHLRGAEDDRQ